MKKLLLTFGFISVSLFLYAQCTPLPYQDSSYAIWPDTVDNIPVAYHGQPYSTTLTIKTPSPLIEAVVGDTSKVDIPIFGYVGDWPVDSMELLGVSGLPTGFIYECLLPNCIIPGNTLTCAALSGNPTGITPGIYPLTMDIKVYTHGVYELIPGFPIPIDTSVVEQLLGYKLVIDAASDAYFINSNDYALFQNVPNPSNGEVTISFMSPNRESVMFMIIDVLGNVVYNSKINSDLGMNTIDFQDKFKAGVYYYSIYNNNTRLTKRMVVVD